MPDSKYTRIAISLHWLIAVVVICGFSLGLYMVDLKFSPEKLRLYSYHKWIGVSAFTLICLRLVWRATHTPPPLPASTPAWQQAAANASHVLLYLFMFAVPLSGWIYSSSAGVPTVPFGIEALQLPDLVARNTELAATLKFVHRTFNYSFAALVVLHIAAALKHQFIDKDGLLRRMM